MLRIFLTGFMGAGKTTLGRFLAEHYGLSFIDMDYHIEEQHFKTINQLFTEIGETQFRLLEQQTLKDISSIENVVIATGGGTPCFFDNMNYMSSCGTTVFMDVSVDELHTRLLKGKHKRPLLKDKNPEELLEFIQKNLPLRLPFYNQSMLKIDGSNLYKKEDLEILADKIITFTKSVEKK